MSIKHVIKDYFNFTRKERIGVIVILVLLFFIFFLPKITAHKNKIEGLNTDTAWVNTMRKLEMKASDSINEPELNSPYAVARREADTDGSKSESSSPTLFYFNPNTISLEEWKRLGIKDKTIHTIQNYLSKGGSFKKPEDLQKIYGLNKTDYERLLPYIRLETLPEKEVQQQPTTEETKKEAKSYANSNRRTIEVNTTDTSALIALPGIGSKLAARIISFRDKLGGFYSVDQVKETYGLQDSVFQKIKQYLEVNSSSIKKININTVSLDELKQHPYFRYNIANPVILYRNEHGLFSKIEDIKKVMAVSDDVYTKIVSYISIQ